MSALDRNTDIAITPYIEQHFNLAIAAMAASEDERPLGRMSPRPGTPLPRPS